MANTRVTTPVTDFDKSTSLPGLKLPSGTNANQPSGVQGMIRNDTGENTGGSTSAIEHHNGTNWQYFAATESPDVVYPTSLKMYLDASNTASYPETGTTWFDLTSNGNDGALVNMTPSNWNPAGYFQFDGSNDIVTLGSDMGFITRTWQAWVNPYVIQRQYILNTYGGTITIGAAWVEMNANGTIRAGVRNSSNVSSFSDSSTTLNINSWNNICMTTDGTNLKLYINGILDFTVAANLTSIASNSQNLVIGKNIRVDSYYWNGRMSKVRIYDTALTQPEITALEIEGPL